MNTFIHYGSKKEFFLSLLFCFNKNSSKDITMYEYMYESKVEQTNNNNICCYVYKTNAIVELNF